MLVATSPHGNQPPASTANKRAITRHPGPALIHVVLIAVSIGLACSAFVVMDAVLLRSLPAIYQPERLVLVSGVGRDDGRIGQPLQIHGEGKTARIGRDPAD